jgi:tetratricopeptide (TPR) repeat protein
MSSTQNSRESQKMTNLLPLYAAALLIGLLSLAGCAHDAYQRGAAALERGQAEEAVAEFDTALDEGIHSFFALRDRGAAHLRLGAVEAALTDLETARDIREDDARLNWLLGSAYSEAGRPEAAAGAYRVYESMAKSRSTRWQTRMRIAQLEREIAANAAQAIRQAQLAGTQPASNSIAVYAFRPEAGEEAPLQDQKICRALNILVTTDLAKVSGVKAIAADELDLLYAEQDFVYSNRQSFDPTTMVAAGNVQPARHMVQGIYGSGDDRVVLGAACYDAVEDQAATCSDQAGAQADFFDLETELVFELLSSMGIEPTAEERIAIGEKPTRHAQAFLAYADGVYLMDLGNFADAADAFDQASKIDPGFKLAADAAATATAASLGPGEVVIDAPPSGESGASERARRSATQLGFGMIPDPSSGETMGATTSAVTTVRGEITLRIRASIRN